MHASECSVHCTMQGARCKVYSAIKAHDACMVNASRWTMQVAQCKVYSTRCMIQVARFKVKDVSVHLLSWLRRPAYDEFAWVAIGLLWETSLRQCVLAICRPVSHKIRHWWDETILSNLRKFLTMMELHSTLFINFLNLWENSVVCLMNNNGTDVFKTKVDEDLKIANMILLTLLPTKNICLVIQDTIFFYY